MLEIAENCKKVDNQLAAMRQEGKGENPPVIRCIKETRRGSGEKNQSHFLHKDLKQTCYQCGRPGAFWQRLDEASKRMLLPYMWNGGTVPRVRQDKAEGWCKTSKTQTTQGSQEGCCKCGLWSKIMKIPQ